MLGLVLDEPTESDEREDVDGMPFLMDGTLVNGLKPYFPLRVDYDERYWAPIRVTPNRNTCC